MRTQNFRVREFFHRMIHKPILFGGLLLASSLAGIFARSVECEFSLPDASGHQVVLSDYKEPRAIVLFFMGTDCPLANLYLGELERLGRAYDEKLQIIGINSNAEVSRETIAKHMVDYSVPFPVLQDVDAKVADQLGATRTAEVFLLDEKRSVRYHGRVDDRFGYTYKREEPRRRDLQKALDELLAGKEVSMKETTPAGCLITRQHSEIAASKVTYCKEVSRIIQKRCHECHRPGMVGPFSLLSYKDVKKRIDMITEVVNERRMPPWHADPRFGHWSNNRRMPQEEIDTLMAWIKAGAPEGEARDLPPTPEYEEGWVIGKPDVIFRLPKEVTVKKDGVVPYLYFTMPTNFKEDVWIQAAEARPGNRAVVHHIIVSGYDPSKGRRESGRNFGVCGTAPGDPPLILPPGVARKIPKGAHLRFQMHYTPTGKEETDRSEVGLIFYKGPMPPKGIARSTGIMNTQLKIPAGDSDHEVKASYTFREDVRLLTLMPHMHLRGKDFLYRATFPDGREETLLSVPGYDFNWQNTYRFAKPLKVPRGTRIDCVAHFDNSKDNPANPDPSKTVRWGDQTWEEMMIGWVGYVKDAAR
ncbi:MAG: redoxin domain-containing protein [Akkermansiaceae bacterium]